MNRQSHRLSSAASGIDRDHPVTFYFDGKPYQGFLGDTLASALLANGVSLMGRSFKYHRPRGLLTMGSEEPNAIMELRAGPRKEPNTRATMIELYEGLVVNSQNRFPSLRFDLMSINQYLAPFLTAGFYYKTFMWPASFWESFYEKIIRRSAGLGSAATAADPDHYEHSHLHCDVLVVGSGPAGLMAAKTSANAGARVVLVEEMAFFGGALTQAHDVIDDLSAADWVAAQIDALQAMDNVQVMSRTTLFGYYDGNVMAALERVADHVVLPEPHQPRQRLWTLRASEVVLACGSHERPMIFSNNDKPGVMLNTAVRRLLDRYAVTAGHCIALCTTNDDVYATALLLQQNGCEIAVITDARTRVSHAAQQALDAGLPVQIGVVPSAARGGRRVTGLTYCSVDGKRLTTVACDCIAMSGGFSPDVHLSSQTGAAPRWDENLQAFLPATPVRAERSAGACAGVFALHDCLASGYAAGQEAAQAAGVNAATDGMCSVSVTTEANTFAELWQCPGKGKSFIDFQNDVSAQDIRLAHQEGYVSVEHAKRYTTLGMATDQGKTANVNGIAILAEARGDSIQNVGTTRFRPPYSPVAIGAFAGHERGREFQPVRRTAMHTCHEKLGAVFVEAGQWVRPQYYPRPGEEVMAAIYRESEQVRKTVGICDVSTLGKIEIFGSDTAEFLNRLYINGWSTLAVGKARYGLMLREDGYVFDDGTTSRLGEEHYFMTTTTANAARVLAHMEHASQVLWPDLDVYFCSATEQWCGVAVAGPNARAVLQETFGDAIEVTDEQLPFMGVREFDWNGMTARVFRISFSGEHAYEVNVAWGHGEQLWDALYAAGQTHGIIPYGTEALSVLRIEKGHVAGNELDGRTTAADMGMGRMMSTKKPFIGQVMNQREGLLDENRPALVGLKLQGSSGRLRGGAHLVASAAGADANNSQGWVTSVAHSPALGAWIGLGYLKGGMSRQGEILTAHYPLKDESLEVEICHPVFFDPEGARLRG
ncbi:MAG: sarcosine oxidase subunit alpha family protein [Gammaproteobacteria bacterium]|nr:sarcosine oxidase subunit alpha family protein [Gammaproteobacteria bacterium]